MATRVQKWGNSQGIRLNKEVLAEANLSVGDSVEVSVRDGEVIVTPSRRVRGRHDLDELVSRIPSDDDPHEVEWGPPEGREVW